MSSDAQEASSSVMGRPDESDVETGKAEQAIDAVQHVAKQVADQTAHLAREAAGRVSSQAAEAAGAMAGQIAGTAWRQTIALAAAQKDEAATVLEAASEAMQQMGSRLRLQDQAGTARSAEQASAQLGSLANYLHTHSEQEVADGIGDVAARMSAVLIGGALGVGLLGARVLDRPDR